MRPPASAPHIQRRMQHQLRRDTRPELELRRHLHRLGLRYRIDVALLPRRRVDTVFGPARVCVDVRGCFWHACPQHTTAPKANADWWREKLARNIERDRDTEARLRGEGWEFVIVWEHDDLVAKAHEIADLVRARRSRIR